MSASECECEEPQLVGHGHRPGRVPGQGSEEGVNAALQRSSGRWPGRAPLGLRSHTERTVALGSPVMEGHVLSAGISNRVSML